MELYVKETGENHSACIVFLHGRSASSWMWLEQVEYFKKAYHCIVVDLPEHGKSMDSEPFSIHRAAVELNRFLQKIAAEKELTIIGYGLGGQVAIKMLSMSPQLADYAIISSASVRVSVFKKNRLLPYLPHVYAYLQSASYLKRQAKSLAIDAAYLQTFYDERKQMGVATYKRVLQEWLAFEMPEHFHLAKAKILLTAGLREKGIIKRSIIDLVSEHPNATGVFIPHVGKGLPLIKPDYFHAMVENWLRDESLPEDALPFT